MIVHLSYKTADLAVLWPAPPAERIISPPPSASDKRLASSVGVSHLSPHDRIYLAHFYDCLSFVVAQDARKKKPDLERVEDFLTLHNCSMTSAVDRQDLGLHPAMVTQIWAAIATAVGLDVLKYRATDRQKLVAILGALAWRFSIAGE